MLDLNQEKAAEFLASAGMLIAAVDERVDLIEKETLKNALSNFTVQPDKYMYFSDWETHIKRTSIICAYIAKSDFFTKSFLFGMTIGIAICDGVLHEKEKKTLYEIAGLLEIDADVVDETVKMFLG